MLGGGKDQVAVAPSPGLGDRHRHGVTLAQPDRAGRVLAAAWAVSTARRLGSRPAASVWMVSGSSLVPARRASVATLRRKHARRVVVGQFEHGPR
jgi:hypothetical protein